MLMLEKYDQAVLFCITSSVEYIPVEEDQSKILLLTVTPLHKLPREHDSIQLCYFIKDISAFQSLVNKTVRHLTGCSIF